MKTSDLQGALLDFWTARAEGVPADQLEIRPVQRPDPRTPEAICVRYEWDNAGFGGRMAQRLDYSTNWALTGPLVEKHGFAVVGGSDMMWYAMSSSDEVYVGGEDSAPTALIAICRAVVRAAFGDEVEDLPC